MEPASAASAAGRLVAAIKETNFHVVAAMLDRRATDVNFKDGAGMTPLHWAASVGSAAIVSLLAEHGGRVNAQASTGRAPLHLAAFNGYLDVVETLLDHGADPNLRNRDGRTGLHMAAYQGHDQVVDVLIRRGADPTVSDNDGKTPLDFAMTGNDNVRPILKSAGGVTRGEKAIANGASGSHAYQLWKCATAGDAAGVLRLLRDEAVDINVQDSNGLTALHFAAQAGHSGVVSLLLDHHANVNSLTNLGVTPLHVASHKGHAAVVTLLAAHGAHPNALDSGGRSPLHMASWESHYDAVLALLDAKADARAKTHKGNTVLHMANSPKPHGDLTAIVTALIDAGADSTALNSKQLKASDLARERYREVAIILGGLPPDAVGTNVLNVPPAAALLAAAREGNVIELERLLRGGCDPYSRDEGGMTALHWAAHSGRLPCLLSLLQAGRLHPNTRAFDGRTALHLAAYEGHADCVRALVDAGADVAVSNNDGRTPLHMASFMMHPDCTKLLLQRGARPSQVDNHGVTAVDWARDKADTVMGMLEGGLGGTGETLIAEVRKGSYRTVKRLLDIGVDADSRDSSGRAALHWITETPHDETVSIILALVGRGANINTVDNNGWTPLMWAAGRGADAAVYVMLSRGANVALRNNDGRAALHIAAYEGHGPCVRLLLDAGASPIDADNAGSTPLLYAKDPVIRRMLEGHVKRKIAINAMTGGAAPAPGTAPGATPRTTTSPRAVSDPPPPVAPSLRDKATSISRGNSSRSGSETPRRSPGPYGAPKLPRSSYSHADEPPMSPRSAQAAFFRACAEGRVERVRHLLMQRIVDVNVRDADGVTGLHWACEVGQAEVVAELIKAGCDVNIPSNDGGTGLLWATDSCHPSVVHLLLAAGADVNAPGGDGGTAMHFAAKHGNETMIFKFLQHGARPDVVDNQGDTPLKEAVINRQGRAVAALLKGGADVNAKNSGGLTALHLSMGRQAEDIVHLLLEQSRVDVNARDDTGATPLHYALVGILNGHDNGDEVEALLDAGADIHASCDTHPGVGTALHYAALDGNAHICEGLLKRGADPDVRNTLGNTPLHYAADKGNEDAISLLLEYRANPRLPNVNGETAIDWAATPDIRAILEASG